MLVEDSELQSITVLMFGKKYELNPAEDLELHPSSVGDHLQEQAPRFAFYATVRDMCQVKVEAMEGELAAVTARLDSDMRSGIIALPKTTEEAVKAALRGHQEYLDAKEAVAMAQMEFNKLNSIVKAFEHRREMLIEIAHRANNTTWNDRDVKASVAANISPIQAQKTATRGMGAHPSKAKG